MSAPSFPGGTFRQRAFECEHDATVLGEADSILRDGGPQQVPAELFEALAILLVHGDIAVLAGIVGASVQGRVALGSRAEARVRRLGQDREADAVTSQGPRQAHLEGFDRHANVWGCRPTTGRAWSGIGSRHEIAGSR